MRLASRDSVAITGAIIGLSSLPLGWLTLKSSRIAAGTGLNLWASLGWGGVIITCLWLICLALSLGKKSKFNSIALGIAANLIFVFTFVLAGLSAGSLLSGEAPFARISLGAGVWVTLIAAYIVIFAARQRLGGSRFWSSLISWSGLSIVLVLLFTGWLDHLSILQEYLGVQERFAKALWQHIELFAGSVAAGALLAIPLGIWAVRSLRAERPIFFIANITQTVPSLALFGLLIAPLSALSFAYPVLREFGIRGVGTAPAIIALVMYSMLPIVRNTYVGLRQVDPAVIDAGLGMGMGHFQLFRRVEVPLAAPLVLEGVRIASVQAVGNATLAALIGAGGLGTFVFEGLGQAASDLILLGVIPAISLAVAVDAAMRVIVRLATPRGMSAA